MCLALGGVGGEGVSGWEDWVWAFQSCMNRGSVGRVSVFWWGWCKWGVGKGLGPGSGGVGWFYVCVSCVSGISV